VPVHFEAESLGDAPEAKSSVGAERRKMSGRSFAILLGIGIPVCVLFSGSVVLFFREKSACSLLQLLGAGCLVVVLLAHVSEAFHLFPWMHWGLRHSVGHYVDFWSAVLGLTLFPVGYLLDALTRRRAWSVL
jgi:hypothetical protein